MATISLTLNMMNGMSGPLKSVVSSMNTLVATFEKLQKVMERNVNVGRMLYAVQRQIASAAAEIRVQIAMSNNAQNHFNRSMRQGESTLQNLLSIVRGKPVEKWIQVATLLGKPTIGAAMQHQQIIDTLTVRTGNEALAKEIYNQVANEALRFGQDVDAALAGTQLFMSETMDPRQLTQLNKLAMRLAMLNPAEGLEGAASALKGLMSGDYTSMAKRFHISPALLQNSAARQAGAVGDVEGFIRGMEALLNQQNMTEEAFERMLDSPAAKWEAILNRFKFNLAQTGEQAMQSLIPLFDLINSALESGKFDSFFQALSTGLEMAVNFVLQLANAADFVFSNWSLIAPIIWGIVGAMLAYKTFALLSAAATWIKTFAHQVQTKGLIAAAAAQWRLNAAILASPITWITLAIIALVAIIYLVVAAINRFAGTSISATGLIMGAFAVLGAFIWNTVIGVINAVIQFLWAGFVERWISIVEWVLNVFNGGFNSFGDAVKNLLGQIISWFLSLGKVVTKIIDAIFGTDWTAGLNSLQESVLSWGKNEQAITLSREAPMIDARISYGKAWTAGYEWGSNLFNFDKMDQNMDNMAAAFNYDYGGLDHISKVDEVGKIRDNVDISSEDLQLMRELAEMKSIQNFVTLTPTVNVRTGDIRNGYDVDTIIARIEASLTEQIASSAQGVYG